MKKIVPGEKSSAGLKNIPHIDGELCSDGKKIANGFNKFFASSRLSVVFLLEKEASTKID